MGSTNGSTRTRLALGAAGVAGLAVLGWLVLWWWSRSPQMGPDEEVSRTVDALFTAITARDESLLAQCEQRIHTYKETGKLPPSAGDYLDGIIHRARQGHWESAAERLYGFMQAQRRPRSQ